VASPEYKKICPECKGIGRQRVKGKFIPKTKQKIEEKVRKGGWEGTDKYMLNILPSGGIYEDGSISICGHLSKFGGWMSGNAAFWTLNAQALISFSDISLDVSCFIDSTRNSLGRGFSVRCVKGTEEDYQAEIIKQEQILIDQKRKDCESKNGVYDEKTGICTVKIDTNVLKLKNDLELYRNLLDSYDLPTGWQALDALEPSKFIAVSLKIDMITNVKNQILEIINDKGRSSDFKTFIKMLESLTIAYNNDKFKSFFQNSVDPGGSDVFTKFKSYITEIDSVAKLMSLYNYDPLTDPTAEEVRDILFRYVPKTVYNGNITLQMSVFFYTGSEPMITYDELLNETLKEQLDQTNINTNEKTCRDLLATYYQINNRSKIYANILLPTKEKIQECWCEGNYENLKKIGLKRLFDRELREGRKELIRFLNVLPSSAMGDFRVVLNESVCKNIRKFK
jgi:hypothetical protein